MACEILSPSPAVLDHWAEAGSDGGFRRDTTGNYVLKGLFNLFSRHVLRTWLPLETVLALILWSGPLRP